MQTLERKDLTKLKRVFNSIIFTKFLLNILLWSVGLALSEISLSIEALSKLILCGIHPSFWTFFGSFDLTISVLSSLIVLLIEVLVIKTENEEIERRRKIAYVVLGLATGLFITICALEYSGMQDVIFNRIAISKYLFYFIVSVEGNTIAFVVSILQPLKKKKNNKIFFKNERHKDV